MKELKLFKPLKSFGNVRCNETFKISLEETEEGYIEKNFNPYKSSSISVDCIFTINDKTYYRPGYWTKDYEISLINISNNDTYVYDDELKGVEVSKEVSKPHFNISFKPLESGLLNYEIVVKEKNKEVQVLSGSIVVDESASVSNGKIVINDTNKRYFMYENTKETFIPVGLNLGWKSRNARKTFDYDQWFKLMKDNDMNWGRIWMCSWNFGLHIGKTLEQASVDNFDKRLIKAESLERVLKLSEEEGIYHFLTMLNHGQFSRFVNPEWKKNPYKKILRSPKEFFTSRKAKEIYKDEIRYIVARYGTYDSIMAYELFNEVDWTEFSEVNANNIKSWHQEMSDYLRSIDCYNRLVTTSYRGTFGNSFSLDNIDISCIHSYWNKQPISHTVRQIRGNYKAYKKIIMYAEWGVNSHSGEDTYRIDPNGISLYLSMWAGLLKGASGTTMTWWWDSYIYRYKLFSIYKGIGKFAKELNLNGVVKYDTKFEELPLNVRHMGLKVDDRYYGFIYDQKLNARGKKVREFSGPAEILVPEGTYKLTLMNPQSGEIISKTTISSFGKLSFDLPKFATSIAYLIEKGE